MASSRRRRIGVVGAVAGIGAAGVGAAVGLRRLAVGRVRLRPDPDADEPFGELRGRPLTVLADDGVPLHVEIDGPDDAPLTLVFSHGYTLNQDAWHFQRRDLPRLRPGEARPRLVFWDQRSHGRSGRSKPTHATIDQTGSDLYAVLRATVRPGAPVVLIGHSMGGMSVMALADRHPELFDGAARAASGKGRKAGKGKSAKPEADGGPRVVGVALMNTSCGDLGQMTLGLPLVLAKVLRPLAPGTLRGLGRQADLVDRARALGADLAFIVTRHMAFADKYVSPTVVDFLEQMIRATPIDVIAEFYPELIAHDKAAALEAIGRVPVLVLSGGEDRLTPCEHGRSIADTLPDAEYVEVGEAGHVLPLEYPGVVTGGVRRLIDRVRLDREERTA
ncbi:alpha/beta hydrolase [Actinomadura vinacea]|uniref:Alpha/beta hydrolase n=1 Tax=Actinomadura vinacea TaxID=115336 RepID=A0ABP5XC18_9ACTN